MNITLYTVGKIKENFYRQAIDEYTKRLGRYCKLKIVEVADEKTPDGASEAQELQIKEKEGERIEKQIKEGTFLIALAIDGKKMDSVAFSEKIENLALHGTSEIGFVIGGSLGLSDRILKRADMKLSFSDMTFPHQLMRVILLEQIYRAYRILSNEPYHK
jgi:23S rRNA (pseudouridine1915-N3)-methyltransferase